MGQSDVEFTSRKSIALKALCAFSLVKLSLGAELERITTLRKNTQGDISSQPHWLLKQNLVMAR